jgi:hypothetical protein
LSQPMVPFVKPESLKAKAQISRFEAARGPDCVGCI